MNRFLRALFMLCFVALASNVQAFTVSISTRLSSGNTYSGCMPTSGLLIVPFTANVSGCSGTSSYQWTVVTSSGTRTYGAYSTSVFLDSITAAGSYTITATVTCGGSSVTSSPFYVNLHGMPRLGFVSSTSLNRIFCDSATITLRDSSVDADTTCGYSLNWFVDGSISSGRSVTRTFAPGSYSVRMVYNNTCGCRADTSFTNVINVRTGPIACSHFTDDSVACSAPATFYYTGECSSGGTAPFSYRWYFSDGTSASGATPFHTFTIPGYFSDSLVVTDSAGCIASVVRDSDVFVPNNTTSIAMSRSSICYGDTITAISTTSGTAATSWAFYVMDPGGDTIATSSGSTNPYNFQVVDTTGLHSGTFRVTVVAFDSRGCSSTATTTFVVRESPTATLSIDKHYYCTTPVTVRFTPTVTYFGSSSTSYHYYFGNGHDSAVNVFPITYTYPATTSVGSTICPSFVVTDGYGCKDSVRVDTCLDLSVPAFRLTKSADSGCASVSTPLMVDFHFDISRPSSLPFFVDSVQINDSTVCIGSACADMTYGFTGSGAAIHDYYHYVRYFWRLPAAYGGCTGSLLDSLRAGGAHPDADSIYSYYYQGGVRKYADSICPGTTLTFDTRCTNCSFTSWHIVNGVGFSVDTSGSTLALDSTSAVYLNYNPFGFILDPHRNTYPARVVVSLNGCFDTLVKYIYVYHPDSGTIVSAPFCNNRDSIAFTWLIRDSSSVIHYLWDFGDGTPRRLTTVDTAIHRYSSPGTYTVTAWDTANATNKHCYNHQDYIITIGSHLAPWALGTPLPPRDMNASFVDSICINSPEAYLAPLQADGSAYTNYTYKFGDGATFDGIDTTTTHAYSARGTYSVRIKYQITGANGTTCVDSTFSKTVKVYGPMGGFTMNDSVICSGGTVRFTDNFSGGGIPIINRHHWNFNASPSVPRSNIPNSDNIVTGTTVTTRFDTAGLYTVTLNDSDIIGCSATESHTVRVIKPQTLVKANRTVACPGYLFTFTDTTKNCTYSWSFDNGAHFVSGDSVVSNAFSAVGTYTVICRIVTTGGDTCSTQGQIVVLVRRTPVSMINIGDVSPATCPPFHVILAGTDFSMTYNWTITPGGATASGLVYTNDIMSAGTYNITMRGTDSLGCSSDTTMTVVIGGPSGYLVVEPDSGCNPIPVRVFFVDTAYAVASGASYIWTTCPDGTISTTTDTIHLSYATAGVYCPPSLLIQDNSGCTSQFAYPDSMRVFPLPFLHVNHIPVLCYDSVATLTASGGEHYTWKPSYGIDYYHPGDSAYVTVGPHVSTVYTVVGTTIHGCQDSLTTSVVVDPELHLRVRGKDSVCIGLCDTLIASGVPGANYIWTGVGSSTAVGDTNVVCITSTKTYTVSGRDAAGCAATTTFKVTINPSPVLHVIPNNPLYICKRYDTTHLYAIGAETYSWKPMNYLTDYTSDAPICYTPNNLIYTLTGTTKFGCTDSITVPVTVYDTTVVSVAPDTSICYGTSARLRAYGGGSYSWKPALSLDDATSWKPVATPSATTVYTVTIRENPCFTRKRTETVYVVQPIQLKVPPSGTILAGDSYQLYAITTNPEAFTTYSYTWAPADTTLSCVDCPRPLASPLVTTTYTVVASSREGCEAKAEVTVNIICESSQVFIPNSFTPNGDGLNDHFYVSGKGIARVKSMQVYNRWGQLVYESNGMPANDNTQGWDGTFNGTMLSPDVFVYRIVAECASGETFSFQGDISIVR